MSNSKTHQLLVISNETVEGDTLHDVIRRRSAGRRTHVTIVAPALNSRVRHWVSDEDGARREAQARLVHSLERLDRAGIQAEGWVGDADPMLAIEDALGVYDADELVVATHPEARSNWLARRLVERARDEFGLPVTHVVVDPAVPSEHLAAA